MLIALTGLLAAQLASAASYREVQSSLGAAAARLTSTGVRISFTPRGGKELSGTFPLGSSDEGERSFSDLPEHPPVTILSTRDASGIIVRVVAAQDGGRNLDYSDVFVAEQRGKLVMLPQYELAFDVPTDASRISRARLTGVSTILAWYEQREFVGGEATHRMLRYRANDRAGRPIILDADITVSSRIITDPTPDPQETLPPDPSVDVARLCEWRNETQANARIFFAPCGAASKTKKNRA